MDVFPPSLAQFGVAKLDDPDWGFKDSTDADVQESSLGDGYVFREPSGLNYLRRTWSPSWSNLDPDVAEYLYDFLEARLKLTPMKWVHPTRGTTVQVTARTIELTWDQWNNGVLDVTFEQDFNPGA